MRTLTLSFFILLASFAAAQSWQWQNPLPQGNTLLDIKMTDASTTIACGSGGTILKTTNGGTSWTISESGTLSDIYSLFFLDANTGFVAGDTGLIMKTSDGGLTWSNLPSSTQPCLSARDYLQ